MAELTLPDCILFEEQYQILICRLCRAAIRSGGSVESHFRQIHQLKGQVLQDIKNYFSDLETQDPLQTELLADGSAIVDSLAVLDGYSCTQCRFLTTARDNITRHWRTARHEAAVQGWTEVRLQSWCRGRYARYWI